MRRSVRTLAAGALALGLTFTSGLVFAQSTNSTVTLCSDVSKGTLTLAPASGCGAKQTAVSVATSSGLAALQSKVTSVETALPAVQNQLTAAEGNISTLQSNTSALQSTVAAAQGSISTLQGDTQALQTAVSKMPKGLYRRTEGFKIAPGGILRKLLSCDAGDLATGGGYYFLGNGPMGGGHVEVFTNQPISDYTKEGTGWDLGIRNITTAEYNGVITVMCADLQ